MILLHDIFPTAGTVLVSHYDGDGDGDEDEDEDDDASNDDKEGDCC